MQLSNDSNENSFNLFYSRDEDIFIEINHKETILKKEDLLILEVEPNCKIDIRLNTSYPTHILYMNLYKN